ncbi:hypothetical protein SprV_0301288000 [Sparganum proliferum]
MQRLVCARAALSLPQSPRLATAAVVVATTTDSTAAIATAALACPTYASARKCTGVNAFEIVAASASVDNASTIYCDEFSLVQ